MAEGKIAVPDAPSLLPTALKKKWAKAYEDAFKEALDSGEGNESDWHQAARCEANRMMRVAAPKTYEDAKDLEDWQVIARDEKDGVLKGVTIDGKKFRFDAPKKKEQPKAPATA